MEFALSADQEALRDAARQLLEGHASIDRARAVVGPGESPTAGAANAVDDFDRELWRVMVEQGWPAVEEPEGSGGLGLGPVELAVLCEEVGRVVAPVPFLGHCLALDALRRAEGSDGPGSREAGAMADRLAGGAAVACLAFAPGTASVSGASRDDERQAGWVALTCAPEPTHFAAVADLAVVASSDAVFAVDLSGRRPEAQPAMDRTRPVCWLRLEEAPALLIGDARAAARVLDRAATTLSAELLGAADRVLAMSVDYAGQRVQFGRPIGSFQAVKHRLADVLVDVEGMRSSVYYAAWCLAAGHTDASLAASAAKAWCSDAGRRVMASGLQVHGGIGFTWEHDLHLFVKRAQLDAVTFGDAEFHRDRLAGLLAARPAEAPALF